MHLGDPLRERLARTPQRRMQPVEIAPKRPARTLEGFGRHRLLKSRTVRRQFKQELLDEGRTVKVRQLGIAHAPRMRLGEGQQRLRRTRRCCDHGLVGDEGQLRRTPRRFQTVGRHREIDAHRLALIDERPVRQLLGPRPKEHPGRFEVAEVLAIDPHQVDRATLLAPGLRLGLDAFDDLRRVGDLHVLHRYTVALLHLACRPVDVGVDRLAAAPGVEVDRLAFRLRLDRFPVRPLCQSARGQASRGETQH